MNNFEKRLKVLEGELLPGPATLDFQFTLRMGGEDDEEIDTISNHLAEAAPENWHKTWHREPGESYLEFKERTRADVLQNLHMGKNGAIYNEYSETRTEEARACQ